MDWSILSVLKFLLLIPGDRPMPMSMTCLLETYSLASGTVVVHMEHLRNNQLLIPNDDNEKNSAGNDDDNMNTVNDLAPADVTDGWTPRLETKQISEMWAPVSSCQRYQQQHLDQTPKSRG